jgi:hypothetical protein
MDIAAWRLHTIVNPDSKMDQLRFTRMLVSRMLTSTEIFATTRANGTIYFVSREGPEHYIESVDRKI